MGPTWVLSAPDGPHVGPMNLAIRVVFYSCSGNTYCYDWQSTRNMLWWCNHNKWPNLPQFTDCIKDLFLVNKSCFLSLIKHNSYWHGSDKALPEPIYTASAICVNARPEWAYDLDPFKTQRAPFFFTAWPCIRRWYQCIFLSFFFKVPSAQIGFINVMCQITKVNVVLWVKIVVVFITEPCYFQSFRNSTSMNIAFPDKPRCLPVGHARLLKQQSCVSKQLYCKPVSGRDHVTAVYLVYKLALHIIDFFRSIHSLQNLCAHSDTAIEHAR